MIKAIIFDCFGVLTSDNWTDFQQRHLSNRFKKAWRAQELNRRSDLGLLSFNEWVAGMAVITGLSEEQVRIERNQYTDNKQLLDYINSHIRPQYHMGLVSNVGRGYRKELFQSWRRSKLFDEIVLSHEVGVAKPDEQIYQIIASRLGVATFECLFIDDKQSNIDGAVQAGMQGIVYNEFELFTQQIEGVLSEDTSYEAQ